MSRFDVDKFEPAPDPDFICCICQCVLDTPVESPCRHVFCKVCIETWLKNHSNCPTCRRALRSRRLKLVVPILQNMINRLIMKCDYRENGCEEKINLENYERHVQSCGFEKVKCRFSRCGKLILKKDLEEHENNTCEHREVKCRGRCQLMIPVNVYESHDCFEELQKFASDMGTLAESLKKKLEKMKELMDSLQNQMSDITRELEEARQNNSSPSWTSDFSSVTSDESFRSNSSMENLIDDIFSDIDVEDESRHSSDVEILEVESDPHVLMSTDRVSRRRRRMSSETSDWIQRGNAEQRTSSANEVNRNHVGANCENGGPSDSTISLERTSDVNNTNDNNSNEENRNVDISYSHDLEHSIPDVFLFNSSRQGEYGENIESSDNTGRRSPASPFVNLQHSDRNADVFASSTDADVVSSTTLNTAGAVSYSGHEHNCPHSGSADDVHEGLYTDDDLSNVTRDNLYETRREEESYGDLEHSADWSPDIGHYAARSLENQNSLRHASQTVSDSSNQRLGDTSSTQDCSTFRSNLGGESYVNGSKGVSVSDNVGIPCNKAFEILPSKSHSNSKKRKIVSTVDDKEGCESISSPSYSPLKRQRHDADGFEKTNQTNNDNRKASYTSALFGSPQTDNPSELNTSKSRVSVITSSLPTSSSFLQLSCRQNNQQRSGHFPFTLPPVTSKQEEQKAADGQRLSKSDNSLLSRGDKSTGIEKNPALNDISDTDFDWETMNSYAVAISDESDEDSTWVDWSLNSNDEDDAHFLSDSDLDTDSSYEVLVPRSAAQMLEEDYASDESDDSWTPSTNH